jgi:hypothetical protein
MPGIPDTYEGRLVAAKLWMRGDGHLFGSTAAHLLRLDGIDRPDAIQVARYQDARTPSWIKVRRLRPDDRPRIRNVAGFRVPVVERVLLEVAASEPPRAVGLALDDALRRGMTSLDRLTAMLDSECGKGKRGTGTLRKLVRGRDYSDERVRSAFETKMLRILRRIEGLEIVPDYRIVVGGRTIIMDFYLPDGVLDIECHSFRWHSGNEGLNRDAKRYRLLSSVGIETLYFTWDETVFDDRGVESEVKAALARRGWAGSSPHQLRQAQSTRKRRG